MAVVLSLDCCSVALAIVVGLLTFCSVGVALSPSLLAPVVPNSRWLIPILQPYCSSLSPARLSVTAALGSVGPGPRALSVLFALVSLLVLSFLLLPLVAAAVAAPVPRATC